VVATDINEYRLQKAKEFGADEVLHPSQGLNLKAERVIVCTGAYAAVEQAFNCIEKKGIILFFAIPDREIAIPIPDFWRNELTVTSSYGGAPADLAAALDLIAAKKINVKDTITHALPLAQIQEGFKIVAEAQESLKVVLEP
jgi:L-iditol 2-dehydrogenase